MQPASTTHSPNLHRSKRLATIALISAVVMWILLMIAAKFFPEYAWVIHIFMLGAEAGVVGGLADWYAITVLFRNPFEKFQFPSFYLITPKLFRAIKPELPSRWDALYRKTFCRRRWSSKA